MNLLRPLSANAEQSLPTGKQSKKNLSKCNQRLMKHNGIFHCNDGDEMFTPKRIVFVQLKR